MKSMSTLDAALDPTGFEKYIIDGECRTSEVGLVDEAGISFGVWECTPGSWNSHWLEWESFTILSGRGTLTDDSGTVHRLAPGALVVIPANTRGVWNVSETIRKTFSFPTGRVMH